MTYYKNMITDWQELGRRIGSIHEGGESGGDSYAEMALEEILGQDWIESAVEHIIAFKPGGELAMNCLRYIRSKNATLYAYEVYRTSKRERAAQAVWLIKHIAHPIAYGWIEEFLEDDNVMNLGMGVLDRLLWEKQIEYDDKVKHLLQAAEEKNNEQLQEQVFFIRKYIQARESGKR